ncbi:MAG: hypothetical protein JJ863_33020 [Deltaproteobacteria bacterium]|nr:hypothetical protein [Deltaproteobacteria bacterium]
MVDPGSRTRELHIFELIVERQIENLITAASGPGSSTQLQRLLVVESAPQLLDGLLTFFRGLGCQPLAGA